MLINMFININVDMFMVENVYTEHDLYFILLIMYTFLTIQCVFVCIPIQHKTVEFCQLRILYFFLKF